MHAVRLRTHQSELPTDRPTDSNRNNKRETTTGRFGSGSLSMLALCEVLNPPKEEDEARRSASKRQQRGGRVEEEDEGVFGGSSTSSGNSGRSLGDSGDSLSREHVFTQEELEDARFGLLGRDLQRLRGLSVAEWVCLPACLPASCGWLVGSSIRPSTIGNHSGAV